MRDSVIHLCTGDDCAGGADRNCRNRMAPDRAIHCGRTLPDRRIGEDAPAAAMQITRMPVTLTVRSLRKS